MPYSRADAPSGVPDSETVEMLLSERNTCTTKKALKNRALQELSEEERRRTGLVKLGMRCTSIPGDPYGILPSWAGNVAHFRDPRMFDILESIFDGLKASRISQADMVGLLRNLLQKIPNTDIKLLAKEAAGSQIEVSTSCMEETIIDFKLGDKQVRVMQAHDIDKDDPATYDQARRAKEARQRERVAFDEPVMSIPLQQYVMACVLWDNADDEQTPQGDDEDFFTDLRLTAQERYWLLMTRDEREQCRKDHTARTDSELNDFLNIVKSNWCEGWDGGVYDADYFFNYVRDHTAADKNAWQLVEVDVFIVIDRHRRVVFASVVELMQLLYGLDATRLLDRALDMWSYFTPLPFPETRRHVVDKYIRRIHPELDMEKATVEQLPNAKMAVAHYGCWSQKGDPHGKRIFRSSDAVFSRSQELDNCRWLFPQFCEGVLGKATEAIRFLVQPLDPEYYSECVEILKQLPSDQKIKTDDEDFLSLFAVGVNGYTQRHRDVKDIEGGLAGLLTLGRYTGPRFFIIGTNHESAKRYAWRKMGRPQLLVEEDPTGELGAPCVNPRSDDDDDDIMKWTNKNVHGPAALDDSSSSVATSTPELTGA
ncbi:hypothetical protein DL769_008023 [Monosporascus sp. CRB-8-3]|nr:hypothetical protein DL769_008023 [Monosporascus sp. CRB-8-3]